MTAVASPSFDGYTVASGVDIDALPPSRVLNLVWYYLTQNATRKQIDELTAELMKPLPGSDPDEVSEAVVDYELQQFQALMAGQGGGG